MDNTSTFKCSIAIPPVCPVPNDRAANILAHLRHVRKKKRLTQAELGKLAGLASDTISRMERFQRETSIVSVVKLAGALHLRLDEIFGFKLDGISEELIKDEKCLLKVVGQWIADAREKKGLSQAKLASKAGMHKVLALQDRGGEEGV